MSLSLIVDVMTKIEVSRPQQAVLLAMADHASDDGSRCFPSTDMIAWKLGYKPSAVQKIMRSLRDTGILIVVSDAVRHRPTEYRIDLSAAPQKVDFMTWQATHGRHVGGGVQDQGGDASTPLNGLGGDASTSLDGFRGVISDVEGCNLGSLGGDASTPITVSEPLVNVNPPVSPPQDENAAVAAITPTDGQKRKRRESKPETEAPETFPLSEHYYDYATSKGLPRHWVESETERFLNRNRAIGQCYRDWEAAWKNWIVKAVEYARKDGRLTMPSNGHHPDEPPENYGVIWEHGKHYGTDGAKRFYAETAAAKAEWDAKKASQESSHGV